MADTLDVITLAEGHAAINLPDATTTFDTELAAYITAVSRRLDALCGPVVVRTITSELHDGGHCAIVLKYRPVSSVSSVAEYAYTTSTTLTAETNSAKTASNYLLDANTGILRRRNSGFDYNFAWGRQNVAVTYIAGRVANTAAVDPRFKTAAAIMLGNLWRREQGSSSVTYSELEQGVNLLPTFAVPRAVSELLAEDMLGPNVAGYLA